MLNQIKYPLNPAALSSFGGLCIARFWLALESLDSRGCYDIIVAHHGFPAHGKHLKFIDAPQSHTRCVWTVISVLIDYRSGKLLSPACAGCLAADA